MSLDHFVLWFTSVFIGLGGVNLMNTMGICKMSAIMSIWWIYSLDPMDVELWCMHNIQISQLFVIGLICDFGGIVGLSYMMVSTLNCVMTCEYGKGPSWELG